ncbi:MAG: hypothetical protein WCS77_04585 [Elusimicrobiaceae bacterium]
MHENQNNDLPELKIPKFEKKQRKDRKGFLPWLIGGGKTTAGVGGGLTAAGGGATSLFAGKLGTLIVTAALTAVTVGGGVSIYKFTEKSKALQQPASGLLGSYNNNYYGNSGNGSGYVPAMDRVAGSSKSSIEMFSERNKGALLDAADLSRSKEVKINSDKLENEALPSQGKNPSNKPPGVSAPNIEIPKLQDTMGGSPFSNISNSGGQGLGGFGGSGGLKNTAAIKPPNMNFIGAGMGSALNTGKTGKVANKRFGYQEEVKRDKVSSNSALGQAKGIRSSLSKMDTSRNDSVRGGVEDAWEGRTGDGNVEEVPGAAGTGAGAGSTGSGGGGSGGVVTGVQGLDDATTTFSTTETSDEATTPESSEGGEDSPWSALTIMAMVLLVLAIISIILLGIAVMIREALRGIPIIGPILAEAWDGAVCIPLLILTLILGIMTAIIGAIVAMTSDQATIGAGIGIAGVLIAIFAALAYVCGPIGFTLAIVGAALAAGVALISAFLG